MITQLAINLEGSSSQSMSSSFATIMCPADSVDYCPLRLHHSHRTSTYSLLKEAPCKLIINQKVHKLQETSAKELNPSCKTWRKDQEEMHMQYFTTREPDPFGQWWNTSIFETFSIVALEAAPLAPPTSI